MVEFSSDWTRHHDSRKPIGYMMRAAETPNWLRFHSLPESKRYAETDAEWSILLARQNGLAQEVLGSGEPCWLVQACWQAPDAAADVGWRGDPFYATRAYGLENAFEFLDDDVDRDEPFSWLVTAKLVAWQPGLFDHLLREVADDRAAPTLWMAAATGAVFAPYDGGVDLFLRSSADVERLASRHPDWLSQHPSGL